MSGRTDCDTPQKLGFVRRLGCALRLMLVEQLESRVLRAAFLTIVLIAAVEQFVGWKYLGVFSKEAVFALQSRLSPWGADLPASGEESGEGHSAGGKSAKPAGEPGGHEPATKEPPPGANGIQPAAEQREPVEGRVVTLLIGSEYFAAPSGFDHLIPLPAGRLWELLERIGKAAHNDTRIVIDFDLSPRRETAAIASAETESDSAADSHSKPDPDAPKLNAWLAANAWRLVLVEPSWALRPGIVQAQLQWMQSLCAPHGSAAPALFAQSAVVSMFGLVNDEEKLWDEKEPAWDIGRAVADQIGEHPQKRNPMCRMLPPIPPDRSAASDKPNDDGDALIGDLALLHHLPIPPQQMAAKPTKEGRLLRQEFLGQPPCILSSLDDVDLHCEREDVAHTSQSLKKAAVILLGGAWRFGYGDQHRSFVGDIDGARVHAAWIRSWLKPVEHLPLPFHILIDVIAVECFLHPILEYALRRLRRYSRRQVQPAQRPWPGRGVVVMSQLGLVAAIIAALLATTVTLCLIDLSLRAVTTRTIAVDVTVLALVSWLFVTSYAVSAESPTNAEASNEGRSEAVRAAHWMIVGGFVAWLVMHAMGEQSGVPAAWRSYALISTMSAVGLLYFASAIRRRMQAFAASPAAVEPGERQSGEHESITPQQVAERWASWSQRLGTSLASGAHSLAGLRFVPRLLLSHRPRDRHKAMSRSLDFIGAALWLGVWLFSLVTLFRSQLYGIWLATLGG